jgi:hypothetical protein
MLRLLLSCTVAISLITNVFAVEKSTRTCRIIFLEAPGDAPEKIFLSDGVSIREVELPQMNLSEVYALAEGDITLRMFSQKITDLAAVPVAAPSVTIAAAVKDIYLLVSTDPTNKIAPVKMSVINANADSFKKGQMLWFNLTKNQVGGRVGERDLAMAANSKTILDAPSKTKGDYNVNLTFRIPGDERLFPLCETKWQFDDRTRNIYFIVPVAGSRSPRILGFPDYREEPKETKEP